MAKITDFSCYSTLINQTGTSNKIYNIQIQTIPKGDTINSSPQKTATSTCYEVYSTFGKIDSELRFHHFRVFFSHEAAKRFAERVKQSKLQKGYLLKQVTTSPGIKKEKITPLFDKLPQIRPAITSTQKTRFDNLD